MPRPRSLSLIKALKDVADGKTAYQAAKDNKVAQAAISRARKYDRTRCKCCGQIIGQNVLKPLSVEV